MIRVPEDKSVEICVNFQMFNENGFLAHEDELWARVNEEQYNRIKNSFDSGKFSKMSDDESLSDLCSSFEKEIRKAKWQVFRFDYPTDITEGFTFEDETMGQWDEEGLNEMLDAVFTGFTPEEEAEIDAIADAAYNEALRADEIDEIIVGLIDWMRKNGFDVGQRYFDLNDDNDKYVGSFDIAWPFGVHGLQGGVTKPLALRIDADDELVNAAKELGFTCFTSIEELKAFIEQNYGRR